MFHTNNKPKLVKILTAILGLSAFAYYNNSTIISTLDYDIQTAIRDDLHSLSIFVLTLLSSFLFARGIYGFLRDRQNQKSFGTIILGYHWATKLPVQLTNDKSIFAEKLGMSSKTKMNFFKVFLVAFIIMTGMIGVMYGYDLMTGFDSIYSKIRQTTGSNVIAAGVVHYGKSEAAINLIAAIEIVLQTAFVLIFARGIIGCYHDRIISVRQNQTIFFEDVELPVFNNLFGRFKRYIDSRRQKENNKPDDLA